MYQEALALGTLALAINDAELGQLHPTSIDTLKFMRDITKKSGDRAGWEQHYRQIYARRKRAYVESTERPMEEA